MTSVAALCVGGGVAACVAELFTLPLDTAKVRLQLSNRSGAAATTSTAAEGGAAAAAAAAPKPYNGLGNTVIRMAREEGPLSLWKGLAPGCVRQMVFAGLRLGTYEVVRDFYAMKVQGTTDIQHTSFGVKVVAGLTTGAGAISVAQPADLLKIRIQGDQGEKPKYNRGMARAFARIAREEGMLGLWTGIGPNIARNSIINAAELVTYDVIKTFILDRQWMQDGVPCHLVSGLGAGFFGTVVGSPFDVIKTRIMNSAVGPDGKPEFRGLVHAFTKTFQKEGAMAFYQGFVPNFMRIGSWNVVMFLTYEQIKARIIYPTYGYPKTHPMHPANKTS